MNVFYNKIKVALVGSYPPIRGISPYCAELAEALSKYLNVLFISFKHIYPSFLYPDGLNQFDTSYKTKTNSDVKVKRRLTWYNPVTWIVESIKNEYDLVHAQWWSLPIFHIYLIFFLTAKARKKPVIITVHNVLPHEPGIIFIIISRLIFIFPDHFIVHTNKNKKQLIDYFGISEQKISVIPHGPIEAYASNDNAKINPNLFRRLNNIDANSKILLLFGAIRDYKGIDVAIKALKLLTDKGIKCHLVIAGKEWTSTQCYKEQAYDLGIENKVTFHTDYIPSSDIYSYFKASDLVILPYKHFDAQSGVAGVAASFGKPMIVSDTGGLSEWVADKAWAIPAGDHEALASAIEKCIESPDILDKMSKDSSKLAKLYSWAGIAEKTYKLYEKLLRVKA